MNRSPLQVTLCAALLLSACAQQATSNNPALLQGESQPMNGGNVSTWATTDASGQITQAGVTVPMTTITNGPTSGPPLMTQIDFPDQVQDTTFLNHLMMDWNPQGHPPMERYGAPHFDLHFHGISKAAAHAIDCTDLTVIDPNDVPPGWLPPVPPGDTPQQHCVPMMGFHSIPATELTETGQLQPGLFDKVMIAGSYAGKFIFLEPMITQDLLLKKQNFTLPVPIPPNLATATRYPTKFEAVYDQATDAYRFILSDFNTIQ